MWVVLCLARIPFQEPKRRLHPYKKDPNRDPNLEIYPCEDDGTWISAGFSVLFYGSLETSETYLASFLMISFLKAPVKVGFWN